MSIGMTEILIGFFLAAYIYALVERICKAFEQCSINKSMANVYNKVDSSWLNDLVKKKTETKEI